MISPSKEAVEAGTKIGLTWGAFTVGSWYDVSYMLASILSALFILDFIWKKWIRPFAEWRGWLQKKAPKVDE
jgi:hypothetical protein